MKNDQTNVRHDARTTTNAFSHPLRLIPNNRTRYEDGTTTKTHDKQYDSKIMQPFTCLRKRKSRSSSLNVATGEEARKNRAYREGNAPPASAGRSIATVKASTSTPNATKNTRLSRRLPMYEMSPRRSPVMSFISF